MISGNISTKEARDGRTRAILSIKILLFSASIIPCLAAGALAYIDGTFSVLDFILVTMALFIGQAAGDYLYYYFTHYHSDPRDAHTKIFAGWKPLFSETIIPSAKTLHAGFACLALDALVGAYFVWKIGYLIFFLGLAGGLVAIFFTPLMLRGLKEPVIFITFGPLCVTSVYFVLTGGFSMGAFAASLPIGFFVTVVAYLKSAHYDVKEEGGDAIVLKINGKVIIGLFALGYLSLIAAVGLGFLRPLTSAGLLTVPLALTVIRTMNSGSSRITDYLWAVVTSLAVFIAVGIMIAVGSIY
jgi:1,4-dihydroxy-2-naphthoate octaprenyltransferase